MTSMTSCRKITLPACSHMISSEPRWWINAFRIRFPLLSSKLSLFTHWIIKLYLIYCGHILRLWCQKRAFLWQSLTVVCVCVWAPYSKWNRMWMWEIFQCTTKATCSIYQTHVRRTIWLQPNKLLIFCTNLVFSPCATAFESHSVHFICLLVSALLCRTT